MTTDRIRPRGICRECKQDRSLTKEGVIVQHRDPADRRAPNPYVNSTYCEGSGKPPADKDELAERREQPAPVQPQRLSPSEKLLTFFEYDHLKTSDMREISKMFHDLAHDLQNHLEDGAEKTFCFRQLLLAKDAAVRTLL